MRGVPSFGRNAEPLTGIVPGPLRRPLNDNSIFARRAEMQLFCFPFAGGTSASFGVWRSHPTPSLDMIPVEYPGRGRRWNERGRTSLDELIGLLLEELRPHLDAPFAFLGHSFGALVAFELTRALARADAPVPVRLFVSGARAPHLPSPEPIHHLPDDEFLARVGSYGGIPDEVLESRELLSLVLPAVRSDFLMFESYVPAAAAPLTMPISALGGLDDSKVPAADLLGWAAYTVKSFRSRFFPGGHFFLYQQSSKIFDALAEDLEAATALARSDS